jgi:uncharacterized paraquat-inducible protein A
MTLTRRRLAYANLALLILFPLAWFAPLVRAGLLPLFGLSEISVWSGIVSLWHSDAVLALVVGFFALVAPILKTAGLALVHFDAVADDWKERLVPAIAWLGKLAMADIFLIALYITVAKGIGVGRIETAWGLYLFTACILLSLWISLLTSRNRVATGTNL